MWYCRTINYRLYGLVPILMTYPCMDGSLYRRYILIWISYPHTQIQFQPRFLSQLLPEFLLCGALDSTPFMYFTPSLDSNVYPYFLIPLKLIHFNFKSHGTSLHRNNPSNNHRRCHTKLCFTPFQFIEYFRKHLCMLI